MRSLLLPGHLAFLVPLLVLALATTDSTAAAQDPTPANDAPVNDAPGEDAARRAFAAGEEAFDAGDAASALGHFQEAFAASPRPAIRFNIAICLEQLGRFRDAAEEYDQAALDPELPEDLTIRARELAMRARSELGFVGVTGRPAGAAVLVNGTRLCLLPCRLELDPGAHSLVATTTEGLRSPEVTVEVERGRTSRAQLDVQPRREPAEAASEEPAMGRTQRVARGPSILTWLGTGAAVVGAAGTIGFGLYTRDLESEYAVNPSDDLRDRGITAQVLTNVSLGVAIVGALLVAIDLIFLAPREEERLVAGGDRAVLRF